MFGYVRANLNDMSEAEKLRYRAYYCGLCLSLKERHGQLGRLALTYDMTFLTIFLSSLYEPEEQAGQTRCVTHPGKPHEFLRSSVSDYAADMTIALTWHKCMDDWQDEKKAAGKAYADMLRKAYGRVKAQWPGQVAAIERSMEALSQVEKRGDASPDAAAACFGELMAALFVMKDDYWAGALRQFGRALGRYVYLADAACDAEQDQKKGGYNPVVLMGKQPEDMRSYLEQTLGEASQVFESLPLVQDEGILRNILYSGIWQSYNEAMEKRKGDQGDGR